MEYASKGVANAGLATGIIGTALGVLNNGFGNVFGMGNNCNGMNWANGCCSENTPVTRYELEMARELSAKDQKIALLEANTFTDGKIADVYDRMLTKFNGLEKQVWENTCSQAVTNQKLADNITFVDSKFDGVQKDIATSYRELKCYVDATFVPGVLKLPLDSICPAAQPASTSTSTGTSNQ